MTDVSGAPPDDLAQKVNRRKLKFSTEQNGGTVMWRGFENLLKTNLRENDEPKERLLKRTQEQNKIEINGINSRHNHGEQ